MSQDAISFNNFTVGYRKQAVISGLTGRLKKGSLTAVVGVNGAGKSTLLKGVAGMLVPMAGNLNLAKNIKTSYLPQQSEMDCSFPASVWDLVSMGLWPRRGLLGRYKTQDVAVIRDSLQVVGLLDLKDCPINRLSGGQLQRALFARAIVQDSDLILLDEPFNAVDISTVTTLLNLINRWHDEGRTVLVVVHDLDLVHRYFPQTMLVSNELVAWGNTDSVLTDENLLLAKQLHGSWKARPAINCRTNTSSNSKLDKLLSISALKRDRAV